MNTGEQLVYATARIAMAFYFATLFVRAFAVDADPAAARQMLWARRFWTVGWLLYLLHVAAAFHFVHHWSHAEAAESTARRTAEVTGSPTAAGIYFNYLFTVVWTVDVAWWWLAPTNYAARPRAASLPILGFMFFMVFNAVVVFGRGPIQWLGIAACAVLMMTTVSRSRRSSAG